MKRNLMKVLLESLLVLAIVFSMATAVMAEDAEPQKEIGSGTEPSETAETAVLDHGTSGDLQWTIDSAGVLTITGEGDYDPKAYQNNGAWFAHKESITGAVVKVKNITSCNRMFCGLFQLADVTFQDSDTSRVTNMAYMFQGCSSLETLDLSGLDTGNVQYMMSLFSDCTSLADVDVSTWDTSKVTSVRAMFQNCTSMNNLDLSSLEFPKVEAYNDMFSGCKRLEVLKTPVNLKDNAAISLPGDTGTWEDGEGNAYGTLPLGTTSRLLSTKFCDFIFSGYGGTVSESSKRYIKDYSFGTYNTLPKATREGFRFLGWYTKDEGGERITEEDVVSRSGTLYAHWEPYAVITFRGNGGKVELDSVTSKDFTREKGTTYGSLPEATRLGYTFLGWFTEETDGDRISEDSLVRSDQTLYAHWEAKPVYCNIVFSGNGGKVVMKSAAGKDFTREQGTAYQTLPEATRSGYTFLGWYTGKTGGNQITEDSLVTEDQTLYARWKMTAPGKVTISKVKRSTKSTATVTWKKVSGAKGYEVVYSTSKKLKNPKKVTTTSTSKKLTKLTKNKKYYVKVRAYKLDGGTKIYGSYSGLKTIEG